MTRIHQAIANLLEERGKDSAIGPQDALFTSGRLDSLAAVEVMMLLEREFGIDLTDADFDISRLDTVAEIEKLAAA